MTTTTCSTPDLFGFGSDLSFSLAATRFGDIAPNVSPAATTLVRFKNCRRESELAAAAFFLFRRANCEMSFIKKRRLRAVSVLHRHTVIASRPLRLTNRFVRSFGAGPMAPGVSLL